MKSNEEYWLKLYKDGWIEIDFETGFIYSWLKNRRFKNNNNKIRIGIRNNRKIKNDYVRLDVQDNDKRFSIYAHRLIWIAYGNDLPEENEINHINGIKYDNRLCNLELTDSSGNQLHRYRVLKKPNRTPMGENHPQSKLKWDQVVSIRKTYNEGNSISVISKKLGISYAAIRDIVQNKSWLNEKDCRKQ